MAGVAASLEGEHLFGHSVKTDYQCQPDGTTTITYSAEGFAEGPYPGTFTEIGTISFEPTSGGGVVFAKASFIIDSEVGDVVGTKELSAESDGSGSCIEDVSTPAGDELCRLVFGANTSSTSGAMASASLSYQALIATDEGHFADSGTSPLMIHDTFMTCNRSDGSQAGSAGTNFLEETFFSDELVHAATAGQAEGGGQIEIFTFKITFGLAARSTERGLSGSCTVLDHSTRDHIKCLDVTSYGQFGKMAAFRGRATLAEEETRYRIMVVDNAEPGAGRDMFSISTDSGYSATGVLTKGNIQVKE